MAKHTVSEASSEKAPFESVHFNISHKNGVLSLRIGLGGVKGRDPEQINWVWIVERERLATDREIKELCDGTWEGK